MGLSVAAYTAPVEAPRDQIQHVHERGPDLRLVVLFGSFATGRMHAQSDLDLAILPRDSSLSLRAEADLAADLARMLGREVDIVRIDTASSLLRWQIARDGVLVHASPSYEWIRFRAIAASDHAEMADAFETAARLFQRRVARSGF